MLTVYPATGWGDEALAIAMCVELTVYDFVYLAIATGAECRLVTADRRLHDRCRTAGLSQLTTWAGDLE